MVALNPNIPLVNVFRFIDFLSHRCKDLLPPSEIEKIKRDFKEKLNEGELELILNHPRYAVFADHVSKKDRQIIGAKIAGQNKRNKTLRKIQNCLDDWDLNHGKVTNKAISDLTGLTHKTVDRYSKHFLEPKKEINRNVKK